MAGMLLTHWCITEHEFAAVVVEGCSPNRRQVQIVSKISRLLGARLLCSVVAKYSCFHSHIHGVLFQNNKTAIYV